VTRHLYLCYTRNPSAKRHQSKSFLVSITLTTLLLNALQSHLATGILVLTAVTKSNDHYQDPFPSARSIHSAPPFSHFSFSWIIFTTRIIGFYRGLITNIMSIIRRTRLFALAVDRRLNSGRTAQKPDLNDWYFLSSKVQCHYF
jgi:hypothetical protein